MTRTRSKLPCKYNELGPTQCYLGFHHQASQPSHHSPHGGGPEPSGCFSVVTLRATDDFSHLYVGCVVCELSLQVQRQVREENSRRSRGAESQSKWWPDFRHNSSTQNKTTENVLRQQGGRVVNRQKLHFWRTRTTKVKFFSLFPIPFCHCSKHCSKHLTAFWVAHQGYMWRECLSWTAC